MGRYKKFAFVGLLIAGVGFGVGAAFVPPLISLSATCLAGAVAVLRVEPRAEQSERREHPRILDNDNLRSDSSGENLEVDLHIHGARMHHHPRRLVEPFDQPNHGSDNDDSASRRKPRHKI
jgi:hypothetical protein